MALSGNRFSPLYPRGPYWTISPGTAAELPPARVFASAPRAITPTEEESGIVGRLGSRHQLPHGQQETVPYVLQRFGAVNDPIRAFRMGTNACCQLPPHL